MRTSMLVAGALIVVVAIALFTIPSLSQRSADDSNVIKIVSSAPMRGVSVGQAISNGITLALEEAAYTVGDYTIEYIAEDDGDENGSWSGDIEAEIANRAVRDPDVMVYLGTFNSGAAKVSIPITNAGNLAQVSPGNTWPGLTQPGFAPSEPGIFYPTGVRNYFRVVPTDALQGPAAAVWARDLGFNNVFVLHDGEAYGSGIANLFREKAKALGLSVTGYDMIPKDTDMLLTMLERMHADGVELVYFGGITTNGILPLTKIINTMQMDMAVMGPDGIMEQAFLDKGGTAVEGTYVTVVGVPASELSGDGKAFYEAYTERFGTKPETFSAFGYEAAKVALLAIERTGTKDRMRIIEELSNIKDYKGLFGTWGFDKNGDTTLSLVSGNKVADGAFEFVELLIAK